MRAADSSVFIFTLYIPEHAVYIGGHVHSHQPLLQGVAHRLGGAASQIVVKIAYTQRGCVHHPVISVTHTSVIIRHIGAVHVVGTTQNFSVLFPVGSAPARVLIVAG